MEGHCSAGQSPQWDVVLMEGEEEEKKVGGPTAVVLLRDPTG